MSLFTANRMSERDMSLPSSNYIYLPLLLIVAMAVWMGYMTYDLSSGKLFLLTIGGVIGLALLFNVFAYFSVVFPLVYILPDHRLLFAGSVLLVVAFAFNKLVNGDLSISVPTPFFIVLAIILSIIGFSRAVDPDHAFYYFRYSYLMPIVLFIVVYNLKPNTKVIWRFFVFLSLSGAIIGYLSFAKSFTSTQYRALYGWDTPNIAAVWLMSLIPIIVVFIVNTKKIQERMFLLFLVMGVFLGLLTTQTRAVLVGLLMAMVFLAVIDRRLMRAFIPLFLVAMVAAPVYIIPRFMMLIGKGYTPDWSTIGRFEMWINTAKLLPKYFWFGMGMDSFRTLYSDHFPRVFIRAEHPHNQYARWLFDMGVFGLIAMCGIIFSAVKKTMNTIMKYRENKHNLPYQVLIALMASTFSILIAMLLDAQFGSPFIGVLFFTMLALLLVLIERIQNEEDI